MFFFSEFFRILSDIFSDFWPKNFKRFQNYLLRVQRNNLCLQSFLKSFEPLLIFCRNLWHCSQNSIYVPRVKIAEETVFLFFFSEFFRILSKSFLTFGQKTSRSFQNYLLRVQRNSLWLEIFFLNFWMVLDFLQKPLAWFSNSIYVSRVKIAENFFFVSFSEFLRFSSENFSDFWPKNFKKLWKITSACPQEQLVALYLFKNFEPFWIFYRNLWHGSQNSIYVSRVKIAEETVFLFFFSEFFRILSKNFFRLLAKNFQEVSKTTFCVSRLTIWDLKLFFKFWTVMDFLQNPLAWFSKFYLRVQSKICGRNNFFYSSFLNFSGLWAKIFSDFWPKNVKNLSKLPSTCPEEQFVAWIYF